MKFHQQTVKKIHPNSPMLVLFFIFFQLLGITISCQDIASHNSFQSPPKCFSEDSGNHEFFYLVQQWQISHCNLKPCQKPAIPIFSIYGLWPSCSSETPNYKTGTSFDPSKILDLKNELDREWPSLEKEENEEMWKKEWERHGICSQQLLTQHAFFQTALMLKQTYDLFNMLANRAILPFGEVYGLENISDAIRGWVGHTPQVECESHTNTFLCSPKSSFASNITLQLPFILLTVLQLQDANSKQFSSLMISLDQPRIPFPICNGSNKNNPPLMFMSIESFLLDTFVLFNFRYLF